MSSNYNMRQRFTLPSGDVSEIDFSSSSGSDDDFSVNTKFKAKNVRKNGKDNVSDKDTCESEESDWEDNDCTTSKYTAKGTTAKGGRPAKGKTQKKPADIWTEGDLPFIESTWEHKLPSYESFETDDDLPIDYFRRFLKVEMMESLAKSTNVYSVEKKGESI